MRDKRSRKIRDGRTGEPDEKSERQGEEEIHYRAYILVDTEGKRKK